MNNLTFGDEKFGYYETIAGGAGAGPSWHGKSGVHTHMTNTRITDPEVFERNQKSQYRSREYTFKDGVIDKVQGYEPNALKILEEQYDYKSDDFIHHKLPKNYDYNFGSKYYPDIPTPCRGDLKEGWIEVKSIYTFKTAMDENLKLIQKGKAVILAGFHFEIWIFKRNKDLEPYKITSSNGIEEFEKECVIYYHNMFGLSQLPGI